MTPGIDAMETEIIELAATRWSLAPNSSKKQDSSERRRALPSPIERNHVSNRAGFCSDHFAEEPVVEITVCHLPLYSLFHLREITRHGCLAPRMATPYETSILQTINWRLRIAQWTSELFSALATPGTAQTIRLPSIS